MTSSALLLFEDDLSKELSLGHGALSRPAFHPFLPLVAVGTATEENNEVVLILFSNDAGPPRVRRRVTYKTSGPCATLRWLDDRTLVLALGSRYGELRLPATAHAGKESSDWMLEITYASSEFHIDDVRDLAVDEGSLHVASGGEDGQIFLFDFEHATKPSPRDVCVPLHMGGHNVGESVSSVAFYRPGGEIVSYTTDAGRFEIMDFRAAGGFGQLIKQAHAAEGELYSHAFVNNTAVLGFGSGRIALYDVRRMPTPLMTMFAGEAGTKLCSPGIGDVFATGIMRELPTVLAFGGGGASEIVINCTHNGLSAIPIVSYSDAVESVFRGDICPNAELLGATTSNGKLRFYHLPPMLGQEPL